MAKAVLKLGVGACAVKLEVNVGDVVERGEGNKVIIAASRNNRSATAVCAESSRLNCSVYGKSILLR